MSEAARGRLTPFLGVLECLGLSVAVWARLGAFLVVWECLGSTVTVWDCLGPSGAVCGRLETLGCDCVRLGASVTVWERLWPVGSVWGRPRRLTYAYGCGAIRFSPCSGSARCRAGLFVIFSTMPVSGQPISAMHFVTCARFASSACCQKHRFLDMNMPMHSCVAQHAL